MLPLADRTEERRAPALDDTLDRAAAPAPRAPPAFLVVDTKTVFSIHAVAVGNRLPQQLLDRFHEIVRFRPRLARSCRERRGPAPWRQARTVQRLDDVDIAETGDDPLIGERRLERGRAPAQRGGQRAGREVALERLR